MVDVYVHPTAEVSDEAQLGDGCKVWHNAQVRERAVLGKNCIIGKDAYIDFEVSLGDNVKVQNRVSVYHGTTIEDGVFLGPHVICTNDKNPRAINVDGSKKSADDWVLGKIHIRQGASIGAGSTILPDVTIGRFALVGAESLVNKDVPDFGLVYGVPAKLQGYVCACGKRQEVNDGKIQCDTCGVSQQI